jgi:hypothetical protein
MRHTEFKRLCQDFGLLYNQDQQGYETKHEKWGNSLMLSFDTKAREILLSAKIADQPAYMLLQRYEDFLEVATFIQKYQECQPGTRGEE